MLGKAKVHFSANFSPLIGDKNLHCLAVEVFFANIYN